VTANERLGHKPATPKPALSCVAFQKRAGTEDEQRAALIQEALVEAEALGRLALSCDGEKPRSMKEATVSAEYKFVNISFGAAGWVASGLGRSHRNSPRLGRRALSRLSRGGVNREVPAQKLVAEQGAPFRPQMDTR
jgi:hypothetical protein